MKKHDNFSNCLSVLRSADFELANENDIYRTGIIGQFNLTFELAWKDLQAVLRMHGVKDAETGSPREILQLGFKLGFVEDPSVWLSMLKARNTSVHIYDESEINELILMIRDLVNGTEPRCGVMNHYGWYEDAGYKDIKQLEGEWQHIIVTFDGRIETVTINGKIISRKDIQLLIKPSQYVTLGRNAEREWLFSGYLHSLKLWDDARTLKIVN